MVVKYIKVTFVTIFVLVVGLISTVSIKGANGVDNIDLVWASNSNTYGNYQIATIDTIESKWDTNYAGLVSNDDYPMIISVNLTESGFNESWTLFPNEYLIQHTIIDTTQRNITLYIGDDVPEKLLFDITYDIITDGYLIIDLRYYTSGILKDYWDLGLSATSGYDAGYDAGYDIGNQQSHNVGQMLPNGVSDTLEFINGQAYYVQRVKKYLLQASDIATLDTEPTNNDVLLIYKQEDSKGYDSTSYVAENWWYYNGFTHRVGFYDLAEYAGQRYEPTALLYGLILTNGTYASLAEAQADLVGTEIYYQLAEPVELLLGVDYQDGYDDGYNDGVFIVYENGFNGIINPYTNEFYKNKDSYSYGIGYSDGLMNSEEFTFTGLLTQIFVGIGSVLAIELLPNITIGAIVAIPIVFGIIYFILGKRSKD